MNHKGRKFRPKTLKKMSSFEEIYKLQEEAREKHKEECNRLFDSWEESATACSGQKE